MRNLSQKRPPVDDRKITRINQLPHEIRLIQVQPDGSEKNAVIPTTQAWNLAIEAGLDLVLIARESKPPVVKMCDFGKFKFAEEKHAKELARANRENTRTVKEIRLNQSIGPADYERNIKRIREWLPDHDVRLEVTMKGHRGRTNRLSLPRGMSQEDAPKWPDFILNRVLRDLIGEVRTDRMAAGMNGISVVVRPA